MRVLILSASTGGGHKRASMALSEAVKLKDPNAEVEVVDALEYCSHLFNKTVSGGYHYLATKAPKLYGKVYKISDDETALNDLVLSVNTKISRRLYPLFEDFKPDIVVTCHAFVTEMVSNLKKEGLISIPFISIITDFAPHRSYIQECVDAYIVANDEMITTLVNSYGVEQEKIHSLGIPISSTFYKERNKAEILRSVSFKADIPTVLIMAGSFGVTDILKIYENLVKLPEDFQIIVITGKNKKLYDAFEKLLDKNVENFEFEEREDYVSELPPDSKRRKILELTGQIKEQFDSTALIRRFKRSTHATKPTKLFYFINNVEDYMAAADLIITKPGGLTVSESLASILPMAIFKAFPGQEEDNADYLVRNNMAIRLNKGYDGALQIQGLLQNPQELEKMRENCRKYFKNRSADNIYALMLEMLNGKEQVSKGES